MSKQTVACWVCTREKAALKNSQPSRGENLKKSQQRELNEKAVVAVVNRSLVRGS